MSLNHLYTSSDTTSRIDATFANVNTQSIKPAQQGINAATTLTVEASGNTIFFDATAAYAITIPVPSAAVAGMTLRLVKSSAAGGNAVTVSNAAANLIGQITTRTTGADTADIAAGGTSVAPLTTITFAAAATTGSFVDMVYSANRIYCNAVSGGVAGITIA